MLFLLLAVQFGINVLTTESRHENDNEHKLVNFYA